MVIYLNDVLKRTKYVGNKTLSTIENILIDHSLNESETLTLDFTGLSVRDTLIEQLANLQFTYNCKLVGLSGKEQVINNIINSGYFIKKNLGKVKYSKTIVELIMNLDFPLMILDKSLSSSKSGDISLYIIQPTMITNDKLFYNELKPFYTHPKNLEQALKDNKRVWTNQSMYISDIGNTNIGLRFANTTEERGIIDILKLIIEGRIKGFTQGV